MCYWRKSCGLRGMEGGSGSTHKGRVDGQQGGRRCVRGEPVCPQDAALAWQATLGQLACAQLLVSKGYIPQPLLSLLLLLLVMMWVFLQSLLVTLPLQLLHSVLLLLLLLPGAVKEYWCTGCLTTIKPFHPTL